MYILVYTILTIVLVVLAYYSAYSIYYIDRYYMRITLVAYILMIIGLSI